MDDNINAEDSAMDALLNGMTNVPDDNDNIIDPPTPPSADNDGEPPKPEPEKSWWSEFGEYENEEAFKSSFNELKEKATKSEEQSILWQEKEKEFQSTIEAEKAKQNLFIADDNLARLNVLKNSNEEDYNFYKSLVLNDKPNAKDVISRSLAKKFEGASKEDIDGYIADKYNLDADIPNEDDYDDDNIYKKDLAKYNRSLKFAEMTMEDDANKIYNGYMEDFNKIELPYNKPLSKEELVIKQNTTLEKWQPHIQDLTKSVGNMSFKIKTDDGEIPIELSLNDEQIEKYSKVMSGLVHDNAISFDGEGQKSVGDIMSTLILKDQMQGLLDNVWSKAEAEISAKYEKMINGGRTPNFNNNHKGELNTEDEAMNILMQQVDG